MHMRTGVFLNNRSYDRKRPPLKFIRILILKLRDSPNQDVLAFLFSLFIDLFSSFFQVKEAISLQPNQLFPLTFSVSFRFDPLAFLTRAILMLFKLLTLPVELFFPLSTRVS